MVWIGDKLDLNNIFIFKQTNLQNQPTFNLNK